MTQADVGTTICTPGYSASVRPPASVTEPIKRERMAAYGMADVPLSSLELDHLVAIEDGGDPSALGNLWPQLRDGPLGAAVKDGLENRVHELVCAGQLDLAEAQQAIASNWITAYQRYLGPLPAAP